MEQWEYKVISLRTPTYGIATYYSQESLEGILNELGGQGWELAQIVNTDYIVMKRLVV